MKVDDLLKVDAEQLKQLYHAMCYDTKLFCEIIEPSWNKVAIPEVHAEMYDLHDSMTLGYYDNLAFIVYRGLGKSSIKRNVTLHDIAYGHEKVIAFINETRDQSKKDLEGVKSEVINNETFRHLFGKMDTAATAYGKFAKEWNQYTALFFRKGSYDDWSYVEATGMTSRIRGINKFGTRLTKAWSDDFESEGNSMTPEGREKVQNRIKLELLPAGEASKFRLIFQGTIVHPDSYLSSIKKDIDTGNSNCIFLPQNKGGYFERAMSTDPYTYGKGTWEEYHSYEFWKKQKSQYKEHEIGKFLQEYYNIPLVVSDPKFRFNQVHIISAKFHKCEDITWIEFANGTKVLVNVFVGVDPAYSKKITADDTAICIAGVDKNDFTYIIDFIGGKMGMTEKISTLFTLAEKYSPKELHIESFGSAMELPELLREKMIERNQYYPIREFKERVGKGAKYVEGIEPIINGGKVAVLSTCNGYDKFKMQAEKFSGGTTEHDDYLDAFYLARWRMYRPDTANVDTLVASRTKKINIYNPYDEMRSAIELHKKTSVRNWRRI